ncbi:MAG: hypothetical protein HYY06_06880 [Deltaproteobacteria bacterium]|nr:hypothetical protein [Deltaproteobacteria bacterium]
MKPIVLFSACLVPAMAAAQPDLTSEDGALFDFYGSSSGALEGAFPQDGWDGCMSLRVNDTSFSTPGGAFDDDWYDGRGLRSGEMSVGDLVVQRFAFVPADGPSYARFIDTVRNEGDGAVEVTLAYSCNLGSDSGTNIVATESGDQTIDEDDAWAETDDDDGSLEDPSLGHVFYQPGAEVTTDTMNDSGGQLDWTYVFSVGPGETAAVMIFEIAQASRAAAHEDVLSAVDLEDPALAEVGIEIDGVRNFSLGGAPLIRSGGPYEVDEGSCVALHAEATDREGDTVTLGWDLDNDETYETDGGDGEICATEVDGPADLTAGLVASDDQGNTVTRDVTIRVLNVAPVITSEPVLNATAGGHYEYQITIEDPAGAADPPVFRFTNEDDEDFPVGITLSPEGLVAWDPRDDQADQDFAVALEVDDGDEGVAAQELALHVRPNSPPSTPQAAYPTLDDEPVAVTRPTLIARNATDADGDALIYSFRIADNVGFVAAAESGDVPEGDQGATEWTVTFDLEPGKAYYWQVTATDGIEESEPGFSSFNVDPDATGGDGDADADGGLDGDGGDGDDDGGRSPGCACRTGGQAPISLALLAVFGLALAVGRRRSS